jgi:AcrR family transcriptional regulator
MARPPDPHARSALVSAARKEFVKAGIQKARIEDITRACGLSKGAFYLHYESKEALFRELVTQLEARFEQLRLGREKSYRALISRGLQGKRDARPFVAELSEIDAREDRQLLELLWEWRDVTDVLLRGSQGTEFEGVMWTMLDREASRVETECRALKDARLMRDDVSADVVGLMIVGTYLLVARRLSTLEEKPDFEHWVRSLQLLIADGTASGPLRAQRDAALKRAAGPRRARTARSAPPKRQRR